MSFSFEIFFFFFAGLVELRISLLDQHELLAFVVVQLLDAQLITVAVEHQNFEIFPLADLMDLPVLL